MFPGKIYEMTKRVSRLYQQFQPENYQLELSLDRDKMSFEGKARILGKKGGPPSQRITLHQKGLKINKVSLVKLEKKDLKTEVPVERINTHSRYDELRIHSKEKLFGGHYIIEVEFSGHITDQMHGIYPCYYDQRQKKLIATQFESHHAREVFPCIDEPEAKATFDLSLTALAGETALSNTPIKDQRTKNKEQRTVFETTPRMSTYLLAFVFGELKFKQAKTKSGVTVRSYATPKNAKLLDFSVEVAAKSIDFFEDYFGVPYPLPKLDMVALPDLSSGAMENWGLVTYRESVMLADPQTTSIETKQFIALVVAHELSHQWFGNLVTMKWWDDLWLNESFANLMEYVAIDKLFPEWKIWEHFVNREVGSALRRDALPSVQAVRSEVKHPDELGALFDPAIVYAKGGSLLNMLQQMIGESNFRRGLKIYFDRHKYGSTDASDLWKALGQASGQNIEDFMDNWLNKPGYPQVNVEYKPGATSFTANQQRLVIGKAPTSKTLWQVPLAASTSLNKSVLDSHSEKLKLKSTAPGPLILNHQGRSYFVPNYLNAEHFQSILSAIKQTSLGEIDRLQLLQHSSLLERAGSVATIQNLQLLSAYQNEKHEAVWGAVAATLGEVKRLVVGDRKAEINLNRFMANLTAEVVKEVGWQAQRSDSVQTLRLRNLVLSLAAAAEVPEVLKEAAKRFKKLTRPQDIAPDIRDVIYYVAARFGSPADFAKLLKLYQATENADQKNEVATALTATRTPDQITKLIKMLTTPEVRLQDTVSWFAWLLGNYYSRPAAWQWLVKNWGWIEQNFTGDKSYDLFARYSASLFSRPQEAKWYKDFFGPKKDVLALQRTIVIGLEEIEARLAWRAANEKPVKKWLAAWQPKKAKVQ